MRRRRNKKEKEEEEKKLFDFDELPPNIEDHLKEVSDNLLITFKKDDELISKITSETGLKEYAARMILQNIFQEIRNEMLNGERVKIINLGTFYINRNVPKFKTLPKITKKIMNIDE